MSDMPLPEALQQERILKEFLAPDTFWTDAYLSEGLADGRTIFTALTPPAIREEILQKSQWDCLIGDGLPGFVRYGDSKIEYYRHGCRHDDALPVAIIRSNLGIGSEILPEIVEEFRHLMELRPNVDHTEFHKLNPDGTLELAAEVSQSRVRIRTKYLRQYQAARQLDLVQFLDSRVWEPGDHCAGFEAAYGTDIREIVGPQHHFRMWPYYARADLFKDETVTLLMGKRVFPAPPSERAAMWPWDEDDFEEYQDFIIGEDDAGGQTKFTCDPDRLANYFGANPGASHYLTPVWFRAEVLHKYYADTDKYGVTDGRLTCGGLWSMHIDNDNDDGHVMVWLGDLGRDMPATERDHWKTYNVVRPNLASDTAVRRQLLGQWAAAESPVFVFRQEYERFRGAWRERHDWDLLREMEGPNATALDRLRTPLNEGDKEFDDLVADLHLVVVEALNSEQLRSLVTGDTKDVKSIELLERWLEQLGYPHLERDIGFLRALNDVRNATSHLRGREHEARLRRQGVTGDRIATMQQFYRDATALLEDLRSFTCEASTE